MAEPRNIHYLKLFDIEPINGCINKCKDEEGNIYEIPNCINDPYFERNIIDKNIELTIERNLKMRFFKYGKDEPIVLEVNNKISGKELKEQYRKEEKLDDNTKLKMIVSGVEIKDEENLYHHNLTEDISIYVIIQ